MAAVRARVHGIDACAGGRESSLSGRDIGQAFDLKAFLMHRAMMPPAQ